MMFFEDQGTDDLFRARVLRSRLPIGVPRGFKKREGGSSFQRDGVRGWGAVRLLSKGRRVDADREPERDAK